MSLLGRAKRIKRETLSRQRRAIMLLGMQLVVLLLIVYEFLKIIGFSASFSPRRVSFAISQDPLEYGMLLLLIALLAGLYWRIKNVAPKMFIAQKNAAAEIKKAARDKIKKAKTEPQAAALLLIEFMFVMAVVLSIHAYIDPDLELIPWSEIGLHAPATTIINAVIAVIVLGLFWKMYSYTSAYRKR